MTKFVNMGCSTRTVPKTVLRNARGQIIVTHLTARAFVSTKEEMTAQKTVKMVIMDTTACLNATVAIARAMAHATRMADVFVRMAGLVRVAKKNVYLDCSARTVQKTVLRNAREQTIVTQLMARAFVSTKEEKIAQKTAKTVPMGTTANLNATVAIAPAMAHVTKKADVFVRMGGKVRIVTKKFQEMRQILRNRNKRQPISYRKILCISSR